MIFMNIPQSLLLTYFLHGLTSWMTLDKSLNLLSLPFPFLPNEVWWNDHRSFLSCVSSQHWKTRTVPPWCLDPASGKTHPSSWNSLENSGKGVTFLWWNKLYFRQGRMWARAPFKQAVGQCCLLLHRKSGAAWPGLRLEESLLLALE